MPTNTEGLRRAVARHAVERMARVGEIFVETGQSNAPRRTGTGANSIEAAAPVESGDRITVHVTVGEPYMKYQEEGTGIYGPDGDVITPKSGGVLAFDWPAAGGMVFARFVRGTEPTHWWTRTLQAWPTILRRA